MINVNTLLRHTIAVFFIRITLILFFILTLAFFTVYYYIEQQNGVLITQLIDRSQKIFQQEFTQYTTRHSEEDIQNYFENNKLRFNQSNIDSLNFSDVSGKTLVSYEKASLQPYIASVFREISLKNNESYKFIMLPKKDQNFALVYIKKIKLFKQKFYLLKMVITLPYETVYMMQTGMKRIFIIVSTILLLVIAGIFPIVYRQYQELEEDKRKLFKSNFQILKALGNAIALRDSDTSKHNYRVTYFSIRLAEALKMPIEDFPSLIKGSFLHDVGKIGISDTILLKPGKLDAQEYSSIQKHVKYGLEMVESIEWLQDDTTAVIGYHHERIDGSGYPKGVKGENIPYTARLFAIIDVFDALISKRPYKEPFSVDESLIILRNGAGTLFDQIMVEAFCTIAHSLYNDVSDLDHSLCEALLYRSVQPYISYMESVDVRGLNE